MTQVRTCGLFTFVPGQSRKGRSLQKLGFPTEGGCNNRVPKGAILVVLVRIARPLGAVR
jgi:hypothetical protein